MSDSISLRPEVTSLAALLAAGGQGPDLAEAFGRRTPRAFDAPEREIATLLGAAAVHDLGWLQRVAVRGEDSQRWLNGMVTNSVKDLPPQGGAWNFVLNAQGHILGDLNVWREGDALELEMAADQSEKLLAHLEKFIIMDDVELAPVAGVAALGLAGPRAALVLATLGLAAPSAPMTGLGSKWHGQPILIRRGYGALTEHYALWAAESLLAELWRALVEAGAAPVGWNALNAVRIAEGLPLYGVDIAERDLPQETAQQRALHFSKGCYIGQEIVERVNARGRVHRSLRSLELTGPLPAPGDELLAEDGTNAGHITSAAELPLGSARRIFALGVVQAAAAARQQTLRYHSGAGAAQLLAAPPALEIG
jgi:folate-binding protein YgfZ